MSYFHRASGTIKARAGEIGVRARQSKNAGCANTQRKTTYPTMITTHPIGIRYFGDASRTPYTESTPQRVVPYTENRTPASGRPPETCTARTSIRVFIAGFYTPNSDDDVNRGVSCWCTNRRAPYTNRPISGSRVLDNARSVTRGASA